MVMIEKRRTASILLFAIFLKQIVCSGFGKCPKFAYMDNFNLSRVSTYFLTMTIHNMSQLNYHKTIHVKHSLQDAGTKSSARFILHRWSQVV